MLYWAMPGRKEKLIVNDFDFTIAQLILLKVDIHRNSLGKLFNVRY